MKMRTEMKMKIDLKLLLTAMIVVTLLLSSMVNVFAESKIKNKIKNLIQKEIKKEVSLNVEFNDVDKNFWGYKAISELVKRGIIKGYNDKSFRPNGKVTRSEFATMLSKTLHLTDSNSTQTFIDVNSSSWDYPAVEAVKNYLTGYLTSDGKLYFRGDKEAVREDMAVALVKALKFPVQNDTAQLSQLFKDFNQISTNLTGYVYTAYKNNIMMGANEKFSPQGALTRAEAAALLNNALQKLEKVVVDANGEQKVVIDIADQTAIKHTDATLSDLKFNSSTVPNFISSKFMYNVVLPVGTTTMPAITAVVHDTGKATATITQATALPGTGYVIVTAEDGKSNNSYIINFTVATAPKSTDATLSGLFYNQISVPNFIADTLIYNVVLPIGTTTMPAVTYVVHDTGKATATITQPTALPGTANVVVKAEDGIKVNPYIINFTVATAPKSADATLSDLKVNGTTVANFKADTFIYNMAVPAGTVTSVTATVNEAKAVTTITQAAVPGTANIVVTAENGTKNFYSIFFTVAP